MELYEQTVCGLRKMIDAKEVSCREVLDAYVARMDDTDKKINAYITKTVDSAQKKADELDRKLAEGADIGPLGGIPYALKDNMCTKGILTTCSSQLLKNSGNYYNESMLQLLAERGAVGDICLHYYDAAGKPVLSQDEDPVIGMELEQIRRCPQVIALAGGVDKENAIRGALQGDYIDVLITDFPTARALIKG